MAEAQDASTGIIASGDSSESQSDDGTDTEGDNTTTADASVDVSFRFEIDIGQRRLRLTPSKIQYHPQSLTPSIDETSIASSNECSSASVCVYPQWSCTSGEWFNHLDLIIDNDETIELHRGRQSTLFVLSRPTSSDSGVRRCVLVFDTFIQVCRGSNSDTP